MSNYASSIFNKSVIGPPAVQQNQQGEYVIKVLGYQGLQGIGIGSTGTIGPQGMVGIQGIEGIQGEKGHEGRQGKEGRQGVVGYQGVQGEEGAQGTQGMEGTQGVQGIQGVKGDVGVQGHTGIQGVEGKQGIRGVQGEEGKQGIQGVEGVQGVQGVKGNLGVQGFHGEKGNQGSQGIEGPTGMPGKASDEFPLCVLFESSIAVTSGDFIPFNRQLVDTDNFHKDHTRIVPTLPGWYLFTWSGIWEGGLYGANAALLNFNLTKNGEIYVNGTSSNHSTDNWYMNGTGIAYANGSTDFFELQISGAQDKNASRFQNCRFTCHFIRS